MSHTVKCLTPPDDLHLTKTLMTNNLRPNKLSVTLQCGLRLTKCFHIPVRLRQYLDILTRLWHRRRSSMYRPPFFVRNGIHGSKATLFSWNCVGFLLPNWWMSRSIVWISFPGSSFDNNDSYNTVSSAASVLMVSSFPTFGGPIVSFPTSIRPIVKPVLGIHKICDVKCKV